MGERKGTKGLELWCRRMTEGYPGVNVVNMTTSWRDGLAFCAIIHHFRPDLIEFSKLNKDDIYHNNELAFRIAERHLGIPALLEPEDMVEFPVPDRLSILTYLSQFYQTFVVAQGKSPARIAPKRPPSPPERPASSSPPTKVAGKARREPCAKCALPVFIAERLNVGKLLFHRTCFRCARCSGQLTLADCYETESGEFCCETCPDEEKPTPPPPDASVLTRSLSDEEKSATLKKNEDDYSARFETALEQPLDASLRRNSTLNSSQFRDARSFFVHSQVEGSSSSDEDEPPDLPEGEPPESTFGDSGFPDRTDDVNSRSDSLLSKSQDVVTKETISAEGNASSLVKARMRLFESKSDAPNVNDRVPLSNSVVVDSNLHSSEDDTPKTDNSVITTVLDGRSEEKSMETPKLEDTSIVTVLDSSEEKLAQAQTSIVTILDSSEERVQEITSPPSVTYYPEDLNPFGEDESEETTKALNPFEDEADEAPAPSPKPRKKIKPLVSDQIMSPLTVQRISYNPFEEDDDETKTKPQPTKRKIIAPPQITLNPFWSDDEEKPVPKPRISKTRDSELSSNFGSLSSVTSSQSGYTLKKKKPAPKPPGTESGQSSLTSSPCHSLTQSPRATPKVRKTKKAPPPPTSTPLEASSAPPELDISIGDDFEREKSVKDEVNRNRQSQTSILSSPSSSENSSSIGAPNKSTYGKWKRRKGQAPSRPIPQRRAIKSLPLAEVRRELDIIEIQQQGLEKQGVRLEQMIREKCERPDANPDEALPTEVEEMVLQLFELVNEKNELFRRQAELMYLRRQQKLEEEHADIEYQIRCLMLQPESQKTDSDKAREEELINRLVEVVERRNEIIECLEMDRVREAEEDDSINNQLNLYSLKKEESAESKTSKKEKKKHKKEKRFRLKGQKVDADKDIDESESSATLVKDKKKKKFNLF